MASIYPKDFTSNSLTGTVVVAGGQATVTLTTRPFALEGNKSFIVKLRKNNPQGEVVATTPVITYQDNSSFVSLTANTYTISEGNLISYTVTASNAPDGSLVYYSVSPVTANVTINDFYNKANSGYATFLNNTATIVLQANTDSGFIDETNEVFTLQLRANAINGPVIYQDTANVTILDFYKSYRFNSLTANNNNILNGTNVFFRLNTTNANNLVLYYSTANVTGISESLLFPSNTGSLWINDEKNQTVITLASNVCIPIDQTATFQLQVRSGSTTGPVLITSNNITMVGYSADNLLSGGTLVQGDGYNYHVFTTSGTLTVEKIGLVRPNVQYLVVAGGGGAGQLPATYPGGGGAGGLLTGNITFNALGNITVQIGGGGSGTTFPGTNSFVGSSVISVGGGGAGGTLANVYPGGSGGGLGLFQPTAIFSSNIVGQGYPGGPGGGFPARQTAGGGGGAGEAGFNAPGTSNLMGVNSGGNGLPIPWLTYAYFNDFGGKGFSNVKYFAGGGGSASSSTGQSGPGGFGGGGGNANTPLGNIPYRLNGNVNTGGGAGGSYSVTGMSGGSGIVIIRYPYTSYNLILPAGAFTGTNINVIANIFITPSPQTLYWSTTGGNATSSDFVSNTGSWLHYNGNTSFTISLANNVLGSNTRTFQLQIRTGSNTGTVVYSSNIIAIYGPNANTQIMATGGNVSTITDGGKTYLMHAFTTSDTFTVSANPLSLPIEYVAVGGGGQGGNRIYGGGGGAGGFLQGNLVYGETQTSYTITIGGGGAGSLVPGMGPSIRGANGNPTLLTATNNIANIVAYGGGGGGSGDAVANARGHFGASGGGASTYNSTQPAPGIPGQGNPGGVGGPSFNNSGGGGGAGTPGGNGIPTRGGLGGNGLPVSWVTPSYGTPGPAPGRWFAGGGGGDSTVGSLNWLNNLGGAGGGGYGGGPGSPGPSALAGNVNTGGGGGGGSPPANTGQGGQGGSGIVILRYLYPSTQ